MENKILSFDINQTKFPNGQSKDIWVRGKNIVPLEISLANISDVKMCEGCTQIYQLVHELLWNMYRNHVKYASQNFELLFSRLIKFGAVIDESGFNWIISDDVFELHVSRYENFETESDNLGFKTSRIDNKILLTNVKYPLFLKYWYPLLKLSQKYGVSALSCDFRLVEKKYKLTVDDFLRVQSDKNKPYFIELHQYAISKGAKITTRDQYRRYRYKYKDETVLVLEMRPSVVVLYNNQYSQKRNPWTSFDLFISEIEKQGDKEELIKYMQDHIAICHACADRSKGPKKKNECCGHLLNIHGVEYLAASCHTEIEQYLSPDDSQEAIDYSLKMLKRMIDIRIAQIGMYDSN